MAIKAVIWDIGGVIARTENPVPRNELAADLGVTRERLNNLVFGGPQGTLAQLGELSVDSLWEYVRSELGLTADEDPDLEERFFAGDVIDYHLVEFIRSLRPRYKTAVLSNAWDDLRFVLTNKWKIHDAFDAITISGEEGVKKPDPQIYMIVLDRLVLAPEEAVFVDDFIENIETAKTLGIKTIHFSNPAQAMKELVELLEMKIEDC